MVVLWILTILGELAGAATVIFDVLTADSAPKQAAGAAMAVSFVVIPYCVARAVEGLSRSDNDELKKLNEQAQTQTRLLSALANATPEPAVDSIPTADVLPPILAE
jgi:hypothetical protein